MLFCHVSEGEHIFSAGLSGGGGSVTSARIMSGSLLRGLSCRTDSARIFPISRQKFAHRKRTERTEKRTEKRNVFTEFSTEFFPEFSMCVFVQ